MSSNVQIARTISVVRRFCNQSPLTFTGTNDPALNMGDWVRGFILSPPFAWRWNRAVVTKTLVAGTQDYQMSLPDFGWIEEASITDNTVSPVATYQLEMALNLETETIQTQPAKIAARLDDGNGNITFRLMGNPDKAYTLQLSYQKAAPTFSKMTDTWNPIPDYMSYLFTTGMLAKGYEFTGDDRFAATIQLFVRQLVSAAGGLDDSQINIFLADVVNSERTKMSGLATSQMGSHGRSLS